MSHSQVPAPQIRQSWVRYGPVPRYGHQTEAWQQPDPAHVQHGQPRSGPWNGNGQAWAGPATWNQAAPQWTAPGVPARPTEDPAKVIGIVGLVFSFVFAAVGLGLCLVAVIRSKRAGFTNIPAIIGLGVGTVSIIVSIMFGSAISAMVADCLEPGSGRLVHDDPTITCPVRN
jgi:hypothetical protein